MWRNIWVIDCDKTKQTEKYIKKKNFSLHNSFIINNLTYFCYILFSTNQQTFRYFSKPGSINYLKKALLKKKKQKIRYTKVLNNPPFHMRCFHLISFFSYERITLILNDITCFWSFSTNCMLFGKGTYDVMLRNSDFDIWVCQVIKKNEYMKNVPFKLCRTDFVV